MRWRSVGVLFLLFAIAFVVRAMAVSLNSALGMFEPKGASHSAFYFYDGLALSAEQFALYLSNFGSFVRLKFGVQAIFAFPFVQIFGATIDALIWANVVYGSLTAVVVFDALRRYTSSRLAMMAGFLMAIDPSLVNFSMFALRDVLNLFLLSLMLRSIFRLWQGRIPTVMGCIAALLFILLRVENVALLILLATVGWFGRHVSTAFFFRPSGYIRLAAIGVVALVVLYGGATLVSPFLGNKGDALDLVGEYSETRANRAQRTGGYGTHVMSTDDYRNASPIQRLLLQELGMVLTPLPWLIGKPSHLLAFADSLILVFLLWRVRGLLSLSGDSGRTWDTRVLGKQSLLTGLALLLALGLVVNNGGNAFRMRLPVELFIFSAQAFVQPRLRRHRRPMVLSPGGGQGHA